MRIPVKMNKEELERLNKSNDEVKATLEASGAPTTKPEETKTTYQAQHRR